MEDWETGSGLPDDFDGWIVNPRFDTKEAYQAAAGSDELAVQFICDMVDAEGNMITGEDYPPSYSCGKGWDLKEKHPSRPGYGVIERPNNPRIIRSSVYGQLIDTCTKELKVTMAEFGSPRRAASWDGLGFHWKSKPHVTVKRDDSDEGKVLRDALMPTSFLGKRANLSSPKPQAASAPTELITELASWAKSMDVTDFQKAAIKKPGVIEDTALMSQVMDATEKGFWAQARKGA